MIGALSGIRILELAGEVGQYCGKLLGDMGADVLKIEPPGGEPTRRMGPFVNDIPHPERSLSFFHYNTSKRGLTLNLETQEGKEIFSSLVARADVVIEDRGPGYLESLGIGYDQLREMSPGLILASISPFGETGPYRDYRSCDLVAQALGGLAVTCGHPSQHPLPIFGGQAYHVASMLAATGVLAAVLRRFFTGRGQRVEVSMHEGMAFVDEWVALRYIYCHELIKRNGAGTHALQCVPCRDGYILLSVLEPWEPLVAWMASEGMAEDLGDPCWQKQRWRTEHCEHLFEVMARWAATHTCQELVEGSRRIRQTFAPVYSPKELLEDPHLAERGFFVGVEHPELEKPLTYPGAPYSFLGTPWRISRRAPLIGEHNWEIYRAELGLSQEQLSLLSTLGVI